MKLAILHNSGHRLGIPSGRCINRQRGRVHNTVFYFIYFYLFLPSGGGSVPFVHPLKYAPASVKSCASGMYAIKVIKEASKFTNMYGITIHKEHLSVSLFSKKAN